VITDLAQQALDIARCYLSNYSYVELTDPEEIRQLEKGIGNVLYANMGMKIVNFLRLELNESTGITNLMIYQYPVPLNDYMLTHMPDWAYLRYHNEIGRKAS
jgi:hypothetical protein